MVARIMHRPFQPCRPASGFPASMPSSWPPVASSSYPDMDQCIVSFCLSMKLRVTPLPHSSRSARVASPGCPFPAPFLLSRRPNPQVAPRFRTFGSAGDGPFELPRTSHAFSVAGFGKVPSCPGRYAFSCSACDEGRGSPLVLHLRLDRRWVIELPRCSHHSAVPTTGSQVALGSGPSVSPTIRCPGYPER